MNFCRLSIRCEILPIVLISVLAVITFLNSLSNTFVYDDVFTITDNYFIREWGNFPVLFTDEYFNTSGEVTYRPVVTLSYFIDYSLWNLNPLGFHLTNILLHTTCAALVYLMLSFVIRNSAIPFLSGIFFASHPLLTEVVNGVSYREDLLATAFFLGTVVLCVQSRRHFRAYLFLYPCSIISYLLALCSKETAITLPMILFLFDRVFHDTDGIKKTAMKYYLGFILVSGFYLFLRFVWFHNPVEKQLQYPDNSFLVNVLTMPKIIVTYVKLLFFPVGFSADYSILSTKTPFDTTFICSIGFLIVLGIITWRVYYHSKRVYFFVLWFFITLLPTLNIIPIANIMAERYLYLPSVGFCVVLSCIVMEIRRLPAVFLSGKTRETEYRKTGNLNISTAHLPGNLNNNPRQPLFLFMTCLVAVPVFLYSLSAMSRNSIWRDQFTFWSEAVKVSPDSSRAHNNLGMIYLQKGKPPLAICEFQKAIAIESDPEYHHNLGMAYQKEDRRDEAFDEYQRVLAVNPASAITYNNMGNILIDKGQIDEGILKFKEAIRLKPKYYDAHFNLGLAYFKKGLFDASLNEFKLAIFYEPNHAEAYSCLGTVYANMGLFDEAIGAIEKAIQLRPDYSPAYKNLGILYLNHKKDVHKAVSLFREFIRLDPKNKDAEMIMNTIKEIQASK